MKGCVRQTLVLLLWSCASCASCAYAAAEGPADRPSDAPPAPTDAPPADEPRPKSVPYYPPSRSPAMERVNGCMALELAGLLPAVTEEQRQAVIDAGMEHCLGDG